MNAVDLVCRSRCFKGVDPGELRSVLLGMEVRPFLRGQVLWREGDTSRQLAFVLEGRVKLVRHRASGRELILNLVGPGGIIGMVPAEDDEVPTSIVGLAQGSLALVDRRTFLSRLDRQGTIAVNFAKELARDRQVLLARFDEISAGCVESRLAALFLRLSEEEGESHREGMKLKLPLSRQDLADLVDTTVETAIRIMSRWNRDGVVLTERDGFFIPDTEALEEHSAA